MKKNYCQDWKAFPLETWIDSKATKLVELSSYRDEKGWVAQAIDRVAASNFVRNLAEELREVGMKHKETSLEEALMCVFQEANDEGIGDTSLVDVILGEIRSCMESNGIQLPSQALHTLTYRTKYEIPPEELK